MPRPPFRGGQRPARQAPAPLARDQSARGPSESSHFIYGRHPIGEMLATHPDKLEHLYLLERAGQAAGNVYNLQQQAQHHNVQVTCCDKAALEARVGDVVHQGAVAKVRPFAYAALEATLGHRPARSLVVVLDQIQDPHNLGALVRSAAALGATGVVVGKDRSAAMTPSAIKASAGAAFHLPVAQVVNLRRALELLKERGLWLVGLAAEGTLAVDEVDWQRPAALVVGAEGSGLRPLVARSCDYLARIPIDRIGSLNASVAGAIALYAAASARRTKGPT